MGWIANGAAAASRGLHCVLVVALLSACAAAADGRSPDPSTTPQVTPLPAVRETEPVASATQPAPPIVGTTLPLQTPARADPAPPSLALGEETTLGPSTPVCVGDGLFVDDEGAVHTLGRNGDQACASVIDPEIGSVTSIDPSSFPQPFDDLLQASDPVRARVYHAQNGVVQSMDCCGRGGGAVLMRPQAAPVDVSRDTALRFSERSDRLYLSYLDYDGQSWITAVDLVSGEKWADVPVLPGPWALVVDEDAPPDEAYTGWLVFVDATALVILDGEELAPVRRLSLSHRPVSAVVDAERGRLFVSDAGGDLHVLDAITLEEEGRLPGVGTGVDLDPQLGQLYAGDRFSGGVSVFDLSTLELIGRIPQPGQPVASPADGQLYILEEDVYQADGASLALVRGREARHSGCDGCAYVADLAVDPRSGVVFTTTGRHVNGAPVVDELMVIDPDSGRVYVASRGGGQPVQRLALYGDAFESAPLRQVDGLYGDLLYNSPRDQLYLAQDGVLVIIDGQTLEPLGELEIGEDLALLAVDGVTGALYVAQGERLLRFE